MSAEGEPAVPPSVDLDALAQLRTVEASRPGFLARIIGVFLRDAAERIEEMRIAAASGDALRAHRAAHTLKSSAATLGALRLSALCRALQDASGAEGAVVSPNDVEAIAQEFARARETLAGIASGAEGARGPV